MNWQENLLADLQKSASRPPAPRAKQRRPAPDSILTPWGWNSRRKSRKTTSLKLATLKSILVPFHRVPVQNFDSISFAKPWGW